MGVTELDGRFAVVPVTAAEIAVTPDIVAPAGVRTCGAVTFPEATVTLSLKDWITLLNSCEPVTEIPLSTPVVVPEADVVVTADEVSAWLPDVTGVQLTATPEMFVGSPQLGWVAGVNALEPKLGLTINCSSTVAVTDAA